MGNFLENLLFFQRRLLGHAGIGRQRDDCVVIADLARLIQNIQTARTVEVADVNLVCADPTMSFMILAVFPGQA